VHGDKKNVHENNDDKNIPFAHYEDHWHPDLSPN
jgi:hypothetical protein